MSRFGRIFQRILTIVFGYATACIAASTGLHVALFATAGLDPAMLPLIAAGSLLFSIPFTALFVCYVAFLPSLAAVAVAELFAWRRASVHALLGAAVGGAVCLMLWRAGAPALSTDTPQPMDNPLGWGFVLAFVLSGAAAGLTYWLVAGRSARR